MRDDERQFRAVAIIDRDEPGDGFAVGFAYQDGWCLRSRWVPVNGVLTPTRIDIEGEKSSRPITAAAVRRLKIGEMLAETRQAITTMAEYLLVSGSAGDRERVTSFADPGPQRGKKLTDDDLRDVAAVYRLALSDGRYVNEAVREAFHISQSTAAKRIMRARAAGLLDEVEGS